MDDSSVGGGRVLIGPRAASIPVQLVAVLLGVVEGLFLYSAVIGVSLLVLPDAIIPAVDPVLRFLTIAFCAYFLAAPATWRGLARRALLIVAIGLLGYAVLGYLIAFLFLRGTPLSGSMPALIPTAQAAILLVGAGGLIGYLLLQDRTERGPLASSTVPAPERAAPTTPTDNQS